ncbi:hypothetical protein B0T24DRAFT_670255 [Lasiosphaeria ovina]|uniref:Uncharacterized protein n=1 Tax=Lasiosphaeria ovina TaxID=92902 RepID=A0AAE0JY47_9PEZI|nr:hypothetical protein B0T24DRAFT_670255 [Lasiosphaeria ovina]
MYIQEEIDDQSKILTHTHILSFPESTPPLISLQDGNASPAIIQNTSPGGVAAAAPTLEHGRARPGQPSRHLRVVDSVVGARRGAAGVHDGRVVGGGEVAVRRQGVFLRRRAVHGRHDGRVPAHPRVQHRRQDGVFGAELQCYHGVLGRRVRLPASVQGGHDPKGHVHHDLFYPRADDIGRQQADDHYQPRTRTNHNDRRIFRSHRHQLIIGWWRKWWRGRKLRSEHRWDNRHRGGRGHSHQHHCWRGNVLPSEEPIMN